jgi:hypothetical protein
MNGAQRTLALDLSDGVQKSEESIKQFEVNQIK